MFTLAGLFSLAVSTVSSGKSSMYLMVVEGTHR